MFGGLTPWLMIALLLGNFVLMAFDAREITSGQRVIRVWTQTAADFVQSPVTTVTVGDHQLFYLDLQSSLGAERQRHSETAGPGTRGRAKAEKKI